MVLDTNMGLDASRYHPRGLEKYIKVPVKVTFALGSRHRRHKKQTLTTSGSMRHGFSVTKGIVASSPRNNTGLNASDYYRPRGLGKYIEVPVKGTSALGTRHRRHKQ